MQKMISTYAPQHIFLEASGLADPISIVELLQTDDLKGKVTLGQIIGLVDVPNFFKGLSSLVRFKHQLMIADTIILNKTDLSDSHTIGDIQLEIDALNPFAQVLPTVYADIRWKLCLSSDTNGQAAERFIGIESEGRPDIHTCVLRTHEKINREQLNLFIKELQQKCIRIKGFINLSNGKVVSIHSVYKQIEISVLDKYKGPSEIIVFSEEVSLKVLRTMFKSYV